MTSRFARCVLVTGLVAAVAALVWRVTSTTAGVPMWLWLPALTVEAAGVAGSAVLGWALWRPPGATAPVEGEVQWVVRLGGQRPADLAATLAAVGPGAIVLDMSSARISGGASSTTIAATCETAGARRLVVDPTIDPAGLAAMAAAVRAPSLIVLDAGDVPADGWREVLGPVADDVAVVQGRLVVGPGVSAEHEPDGRFELDFEYAALAPALGGRGVAVWTGSGAWIRTVALGDVVGAPTGASDIEAQVAASAALHAGGWRVTATGQVTAERRSRRSAGVIHADRVRRARAARRSLVARGGAVRSGRSVVQRLALVAWAIRPLAGVHRAGFIAVIVASLVAGRAPVEVGGAVWFAVLVWLPATVLPAVGVVGSSRGTLRPGDRVRASVRSLGAAIDGLRAGTPELGSGHPPVISVDPVHRGLVAVVVVVSTILVMRGISDRVTHTLGGIPDVPRVALLGLAIWTLGVSVQLLGRRSANRAGQPSRALVLVAVVAVVAGAASSVPLDVDGTDTGVAERPGVVVEVP